MTTQDDPSRVAGEAAQPPDPKLSKTSVEPHEAFTLEPAPRDARDETRWQALLWAPDGDDSFPTWEAAAEATYALMADAKLEAYRDIASRLGPDVEPGDVEARIDELVAEATYPSPAPGFSLEELPPDEHGQRRWQAVLLNGPEISFESFEAAVEATHFAMVLAKPEAYRDTAADSSTAPRTPSAREIEPTVAVDITNNNINFKSDFTPTGVTDPVGVGKEVVKAVRAELSKPVTPLEQGQELGLPPHYLLGEDGYGGWWVRLRTRDGGDEYRSESDAEAACRAHRDDVLASVHPRLRKILGAKDGETIEAAAERLRGAVRLASACPQGGGVSLLAWLRDERRGQESLARRLVSEGRTAITATAHARALTSVIDRITVEDPRPPVGGEPGTWVWKGDEERMNDATALSRGREYAGAAQPEPVSLPELDRMRCSHCEATREMTPVYVCRTCEHVRMPEGCPVWMAELEALAPGDGFIGPWVTAEVKRARRPDDEPSWLARAVEMADRLSKGEDLGQAAPSGMLWEIIDWYRRHSTPASGCEPTPLPEPPWFLESLAALVEGEDIDPDHEEWLIDHDWAALEHDCDDCDDCDESGGPLTESLVATEKAERRLRLESVLRECAQPAVSLPEGAERRGYLRGWAAHAALHPNGTCTCSGEGTCGWCLRMQRALEHEASTWEEWAIDLVSPDEPCGWADLRKAIAARAGPVAVLERARWVDSVPCASAGLIAAATYPDETDCVDVWVYVDADGLHIQATAERGHEVVDLDPRGARIDVIRAVLARAEGASDE